MKKLSILIIVFTAIVLTGWAQSLQLSNSKGIVANNSEIIQVGTPDSIEMISYLNVKNISAASVNVLCKKTEYAVLDSTEFTMCWAGGCYPAKVFVSPNAAEIAPGETNTEFSGHYTQTAFQHMKSGESLIRWTFFLKTNPADSVSVVIKYTTYPLGMEENGSLASMSHLYPNPASARASFSYNLYNQNNGSIQVRDMVGKTVYQQELFQNSGNVSVNTANLADGIYFCTLSVNGNMVQTRKLVVRH
jgi:hypothetical protein